ncbi:hypothetical protein BBJ28_00001205 [Nothophytophthora sp. Chile5]|nr:hypothetical protein BBJ28_00001205 [Nothophytophthora sp. Chile5]
MLSECPRQTRRFTPRGLPPMSAREMARRESGKSSQLRMSPTTPHDGGPFVGVTPRLSPLAIKRAGFFPAPLYFGTEPSPLATRLPPIQVQRPVEQQTQREDEIPSAADPASRVKDLAARLALLLHARECCRGRRGCPVENCHVARGVLDHCQECFAAAGSCHVSCAQAKHLLRHFRICRAHNFPRNCEICFVLHTEFPWALAHAESLTPIYLQQRQQEYTPSAAPAPLCRIVSDESDTSSYSRVDNTARRAKRQRSMS